MQMTVFWGNSQVFSPGIFGDYLRNASLSISSLMLEKDCGWVLGWGWSSVTCTEFLMSSIWYHTRLDQWALGRCIQNIMSALSGSLRPDYTLWIRMEILLKLINISNIGHPGAGKEEDFGSGKGESSFCGLRERELGGRFQSREVWIFLQNWIQPATFR